MVRTILTPDQANIRLSIPEAYIGKPVEVTFRVLNERKCRSQKTVQDFFGLLSDDDCLQLKKHTEQARKEWNRNF
ncbi:MAG: hypothetical protein LBB31_04775 [Prevotellaceae bacterium]|jgi:hypothetical protein|nr:hypothetical protein [Prevotellaceae bacterium]